MLKQTVYRAITPYRRSHHQLFKGFFWLLVVAYDSALASERYNWNPSISCRVTNQVVLATENGKGERYKGISGGYSIDDVITLTFVLTDLKWRVMSVNMRNGDSPIDNILLGIADSAHADEFGGQVGFNDAILGSEYRQSSDKISASNALSRFTLKRYYRGDWEGIWSKSMGDDQLGSHVTTLNCMNASPKLDEFYRLLFESAEKGRRADSKSN